MALINKNSPLWPALLSALFWPGVGQMYNRQLGKGFALIAAFFGAILWFSKVLVARLGGVLPGSPEDWMKDQASFYAAEMALVREQSPMFVTFLLLLLLLWIYGVIDAYITAKNRALLPVHPPESHD
jgi:hypothetical protein